MKKNNYKGIIKQDDAFDEQIKEVLLNGKVEDQLKAVKIAFETSDSSENDLEIDTAKEAEIIAKLRKKTGFTGIGMAGTSMLVILLLNLNVF